MDKFVGEIEQFHISFDRFRDKRIVLYGIGRFTAALLDNIDGFNFVGLMDRSPENIGKTKYGLPVISLSEAEEKADMIVINTASVYWRLIYHRIKGSKLPIYFLDGTLACDDEDNLDAVKSLSISIDDAKDAIRNHDIVSFDFFDTVMLRRALSIDDVFQIVAEKCGSLLNGIDFMEMRSRASANLKNDFPLIKSIYDEIGRMSSLSQNTLQQIMKTEIGVENALLTPRHDVVRLLKYAIENGKKVFIISDMYLSSEFIREKIEELGVDAAQIDIIVSCEVKCEKSNGSLWERFRDGHKDEKIIHFGDNIKSDVEMPRNYGIDTFHIPNIRTMMDACGFADIGARACSLYASVMIGHVMNVLFNSPFALSDRSKPIIKNEHGMGYALLGAVLVTYLLFLWKKKNEDNVSHMFFFSRDGYFLQKDFEILEKVIDPHHASDTSYLCVSRYVSMMAAADATGDFTDMIEHPYGGSPENYLRKRFLIDKNCDVADTSSNAYKYKAFRENEKQIRAQAHRLATDYYEYINNQHIGESDALVDLSFYGTNQHYLQQTAHKKVPCYYMIANMGEANPYTTTQKMVPCFYNETAPASKNLNTFKYSLAIESLLTAPHGMILAVHPDGTMECDKPMQNQLHFKEKEIVNKGVVDLMKDLICVIDADIDDDDIDFVDKLYGTMMSGKVEFSAEATRSFFYDNGLVHDADNPVFG